jgi:hypothetical protein
VRTADLQSNPSDLAAFVLFLTQLTAVKRSWEEKSALALSHAQS